MADSGPNECQRWINDSVNDFPTSDRFTLTAPFDIGRLEIGEGKLQIDDLWSLGIGDGFAIQAKPGRYLVTAIGADFEGHHRMASMQAVNESVRGKRIKIRTEGEIAVDAWGIAIGQYQTWYSALSKTEQELLSEELSQIHVNGCDIDQLMPARNGPNIARCFTGLGSGMYPVKTLWYRWKCVGIQCIFIDENFELPHLT